ncbi:hypothetical protein BJX99DRAFT_243417 [Aspergillus californicus]
MAPFTVVIIGAGLGGLSCAIQCRHSGLEVIVLERAPEIQSVGAGIQVPPNACRVLKAYGILDVIREKAVQIEGIDVRRYADGTLLTEREIDETSVQCMGAPWLVIHRADYHEALLNEARKLGAKVVLDAHVKDVDTAESKVILQSGEVVTGDVVVGADGLWSITRDRVLGEASAPHETGDLAYRATFSREQLKAINDPKVDLMCQQNKVTLWLGPGKHAVFYPIRENNEFNLVLIRPDNLPPDARTMQGDIGEMKESFGGWDVVLTKILSTIPTVLKWRLMHHEALQAWYKHSTTLLGDACHPTLPYQAQGAAMAVEDGSVLGVLLGLMHSRLRCDPGSNAVSQILQLYETLRKDRTTVNVQGAIENQWLYHLPDGENQLKRDHTLKAVDWRNPRASEYKWCDPEYQTNMLGYDTLEEAKAAFNSWWRSFQDSTTDV